jgi:hypothetical protein
VQKRFFILTGNVLTWEKRSGLSDASKDKGSLAIKADTVIEVVDAGSNFFEFEIVNFRPIKCSHSGTTPYRLGATSGEERDMWVSIMFAELQPWGFFSPLMPFLDLKSFFVRLILFSKPQQGRQPASQAE